MCMLSCNTVAIGSEHENPQRMPNRAAKLFDQGSGHIEALEGPTKVVNHLLPVARCFVCFVASLFAKQSDDACDGNSLRAIRDRKMARLVLASLGGKAIVVASGLTI